MKKVFLIDDDIDDREMFRSAVKSVDPGIEYIEAVDGHEALEMLSELGFIAPDIIFVDLNMPRVTGFEFVIRLKKLAKYRNIPAYIYTTSASPRERVNCIAAGASGYIVKKLNEKDLAAELMPLLSKPAIVQH